MLRWENQYAPDVKRVLRCCVPENQDTQFITLLIGALITQPWHEQHGITWNKMARDIPNRLTTRNDVRQTEKILNDRFYRLNPRPISAAPHVETRTSATRKLSIFTEILVGISEIALGRTERTNTRWTPPIRYPEACPTVVKIRTFPSNHADAAWSKKRQHQGMKSPFTWISTTALKSRTISDIWIETKSRTRKRIRQTQNRPPKGLEFSPNTSIALNHLAF